MEVLSNIFSFEMILATLRLAIPIGIAAVGVSICERAGVINLGVEGMMLFGALSAVIGTHFTNNPWIGLATGVAVGGLIGLIHAVLSIQFKANQSVSGVGINMFASGLTVVMVRAIWNKDAMSAQVAQVPNISIPILKEIPLLGRFFTDQSPLLYISILITLIAWYGMYKTSYGLRLRAMGDHPKAALSAGVNVNSYRYVSVVISGMLAGLAGAYLSIVQNNMFVAEMVAGRGFLAIAANIFGSWNPLGAFLASLVFAFAQAIRLNLSALNIPDQFIQMLPYLITLMVLLLIGQRNKGPEAAGKLE